MNRQQRISDKSTILDALSQLNSLPGSTLTLFVVDDGGRLCGTLTDGDIRRALVAGATLADSVAAVCHASYRGVTAGDIDPAMLRQYRSNGITQIPVTDADGILVDIIDLNRTQTILPLRALLMAGGRGERLRPATLSTPKPLLAIEGKAIIDYNIEALSRCGITDITVATGYLAEQIEQHFSHSVAGVDVQCRREEKPLGTIGAAAYMPPSSLDTLIMNSDIISSISFEEMYLHHRDSHAAVTIAAIPYQVSVPYAILGTSPHNPGAVTSIEEKPSYSYYANAGIYIFRSDILPLLTPGLRCDATDLIDRIIAQGYLVTYYPIKGTWIDVGSPTDFRQASELMKHHRNMSDVNTKA